MGLLKTVFEVNLSIFGKHNMEGFVNTHHVKGPNL
jgi:hypothetical protein